MARAAGSTALALLVCLTLATPAGAAEAVTNGGFESGGTGWTQSGVAGFCTTGASGCGGYAPRNGAGFGLLGGDSNPLEPLLTPAFLRQNVAFGGTPVTLSLHTRAISGSSGVNGSLTLYLDGNQLGAAIPLADVALPSYQPATRDLSAFAAGNHEFAIRYDSFAGAGLVRPTFLVDDVSIQAPQIPQPPAPPGGPGPGPAPDPAPTCAGREATIEGTDAAELLAGTPGADVIVAGAGDDVVRAGAGDDLVCAGAGNDEIKGAAGRDRLLGELGRDKLNGGGGRGDRCDGGPARDKASPSCEKSKRL